MRMRRMFLSLVCLTLNLSWSVPAQAQKARSGLVVVKLKSGLTSRAHPGKQFQMRTLNDVKLSDGTTLVAGTILQGVVTHVTRHDRQNPEERLAIRVTSARLHDGNILPLFIRVLGVGEPTLPPEPIGDIFPSMSQNAPAQGGNMIPLAPQISNVALRRDNWSPANMRDLTKASFFWPKRTPCDPACSMALHHYIMSGVKGARLESSSIAAAVFVARNKKVELLNETELLLALRLPPTSHT